MGLIVWHAFCTIERCPNNKNKVAYMDKKEYEKKIAQLESLNDQLTSEYKYLDQLLRQLGFVDGIQTLKEAAQELIQRYDADNQTSNPDDNKPSS